MVKASAVIFSEFGDPRKVTSIGTAELPPVGDNQVLLKTLVSSLNPSDVSTVQGVYAAVPPKTTEFSKTPSIVVGNEAIFEVIEVGKSVTNAKVGDWALPSVKSLGTWRTGVVLDADKIKVFHKIPGVSATTAAMMMINPPTAYELLKAYVTLKEGDWVIQNGSNSSVGRAVIQLAKTWGFKTLNVVRERSGVDALKSELLDLGATAVVTDKEIESPDFVKTKLPQIIGSEKSSIKLGLDCVCGANGSALVNTLGTGGTLVVYGAMSQKALQLNPGNLIFNDISVRGYWFSARMATDPQSIAKAFKEVISLLLAGKFKQAPAEEHVFKINGTEEEQLDAAKAAFNNSINGFTNKKQVLVFE